MLKEELYILKSHELILISRCHPPSAQMNNSNSFHHKY